MKTSSGRIALWIIGSLLTAAFVVYMTTQVIRPAALQSPPPPTGPLTTPDVLFYAIAAITVAGAFGVAVSRNILYSALGLLMALLGAGSLYVFLSADFVAVTQLLIYIGGVLVLILFAVFLTSRITDVRISNTSFGQFGGVLLFLATAPVLLAVAALAPWPVRTPAPLASTTQAIGDAFLTKWLLPFEIASMVLLATLIGAVVIARKEIKAD
jgi:NAD(P)H-quinone oxidoreductase subunit 6